MRGVPFPQSRAMRHGTGCGIYSGRHDTVTPTGVKRTLRTPLLILATLAVSAFLVLPGAASGLTASTAGLPSIPPRGPDRPIATSELPSILHPRELTTVGLTPAPANYPSEPAWLTYDHPDQLFFVAAPPSSVDVIPGSFTGYAQVVDAVPVGSNPFAVAYDPSAGEAFVSNTGSNSVSVVSAHASQALATILVGNGPMGVAWDPVNGQVYVANNGSDTVSVISPSTDSVVTTVGVGSEPLGVAVDSASGDIFVANHGSSNVTVISGSTNTVIANLSIESGPYGVAVDNRTEVVFVTDEASSAISEINSTTLTVIQNISITNPPPFNTVPIDLQGVAYDWGDRQIYAAGGPGTVVVLGPQGVSVMNFDPAGVAYDPDTGGICVTNTANRTLECATFFSGPPSGPYTVTITESGLSPGTYWDAKLDGAWLSSNTPSVNISVANGTYPLEIYGGYPYNLTPVPVGGLLTVNGANVSVPVSFAVPALYPVRFFETGLPLGTQWVVLLDNAQAPWSGWGGVQSSSTTMIEFNVTNGTYQYGIGEVIDDLAVPNFGGLTVNGSGLTVQVNYSVPISPLYTVVIGERGLPAGSTWTVTLGNSTIRPLNTSVAFSLPNGTYPYAVAAPGYTCPASPGNLTVAGGPVWENFSFYPRTYAVTFFESGLPTGTTWSVNLGGNASYGVSNVSFVRPNGTYSYAVGSVPEYAPDPAAGTLTVAGHDLNVTIQYAARNSTALYTLRFSESGLPSGTGWGVVIGSQIESGLEDNVSFEEPNGTYGYVVLAVTGYVTHYSGVATVNGSDVDIVIAFTPQTYAVEFIEIGLPTGSNWSVTVSNLSIGFNETRSTTTSSIIFFLANGTYTVTFTLPSGFSGNSTSNLVVVAGKAVTGPTLTAQPAQPFGGGSSGIAAGEWYILTGASAGGVVGFLLAYFGLRRRKPPIRIGATERLEPT